MRLATFNAGLAVGVLPHVTERLPHVLSALASLDVDLLFVQEFWLNSHWAALHARLREKLPHVVRQQERPPKSEGGCTRQQLEALRHCAEQHCAGLRDEALARCVVQHCASVALSLPTGCLNCIARSPTGTLDEIFERCTGAEVPSSPGQRSGGLQAYGGSFGTGLLLKDLPLETDSIQFVSTLNARGAVWVRIQPPGFSDLHVFATHLSPVGREQEPQVERLLSWIDRKAGSADAILLGDLNTTPGSRLFERFRAAGFAEDAHPPRATFSTEGLLTGYFGDSGWALDHILVRGRLRLQTARILDEGLLLGASESAVPSTLSDHAGLLGTVEPLPGPSTFGDGDRP
jgi:endonuclease/exonuclease/phosphatase family metal-dependent hydrolase